MIKLQTGGLYLIPFVVGLLANGWIALSAYITSTEQTQQFENEWSNWLYALSFRAPFKWLLFTKPNKKDDVNQLIQDAGFSHLMDDRVYDMIRVGLTFIGFCAVVVFSLLGNQFAVLILWITGFADSPSGTIIMAMLVGVSMLFMFLSSIGFSLFVSYKAKQNKQLFEDSVPNIQLTVLLSLKSGASVEDVLYFLTTQRSVHERHFHHAYRMFLHNRQSAFSYLKDVFHGTSLYRTIELLDGEWLFAKEDLIRSLENERKSLVESMDRSTNEQLDKTTLYSTFLSFIPLVSVFVFLGVPLVYILQETMNNLF